MKRWSDLVESTRKDVERSEYARPPSRYCKPSRIDAAVHTWHTSRIDAAVHTWHILTTCGRAASVAFGILKGRWKILKVANQFGSLEKVDCVFRSRCLLHNMLLDYDGRAAWCDGVDYTAGGRDTWFCNDDLPALERRFRVLRAKSQADGMKLVTYDLDLTSCGIAPDLTPVGAPAASEDERAAHFALRQALSTHYHFAHPPGIRGE